MKKLSVALFLVYFLASSTALACRPNRIWIVNKLVFNGLNQIGKTVLELEQIQSFKEKAHFEPGLQCPAYFTADIRFQFKDGCIIEVGISSEDKPAKYINKTKCEPL